MANLDNVSEISALDKRGVAASIEKLPDQIDQAWRESTQIQFPQEYKGIKNIVVAGMGGSALGSDVIASVYKDKLNIPLTVVRDYKLPAFVNSETLVVLSSYSGTTEEVLSLAADAKAKSAKIIGITEGRSLGDFLKTNDYPAYFFEAKNNPCGQPRLGLGYIISGMLGLFKSLGLLNLEDQEITNVVSSLRDLNSEYSVAVGTAENFTKEVATKLINSSVGVIGAESLAGNAHIFANQLNETSKTFSSYYLIPELNHHLLEGLARPENMGQNLKFIILESDLYSDKIKKRVQITREIIEKQKVESITIKFEEETPLVQAFDAILISSWITFYLGILNGFDPSDIPWVDYFKEQLAKS